MQKLHLENSWADVLILHKDSNTHVDILNGGESGRKAEDGVDSLLFLFVEIKIPLMIQRILQQKKKKNLP